MSSATPLDAGMLPVVGVGDVLFFAAGDSPIDRAIVAATGSRWVHVALAISPRYYLEAVWPQVRVASVATLAPAALGHPAWPASDRMVAGLDAAVAMIGQFYDLIGICDFGVGLIATDWRARLERATGALERHVAFCSELVARGLALGGVALPQPANAWRPGDLARFLGVPEPV